MAISIFEMTMLTCFASAWPVSIYRSYTSRTRKGKSLSFLLIVEFGYLCGTVHKIIYSMDWVIILYIFNAVMILIDILLYYRNYLLDKKAGSNTTA